MSRTWSSLSQSIAFHLLLLLVWLILWWRPAVGPRTETVDLEVYALPKVQAPALNLQPPAPAKPPPPPPAPERREVFGASRKSVTAAPGADAPSVKLGNTVAKAPDDLKLNADDADSLPIPADDYLVSQMPRLKSEVRIPYPPEAKQAGVEGPVVMDLLIDDQGRVRQVTLIRGPGAGLDEAAVAALRNFEFSPARIGEKSVAVRIRYTYRFVLER